MHATQIPTAIGICVLAGCSSGSTTPTGDSNTAGDNFLTGDAQAGDTLTGDTNLTPGDSTPPLPGAYEGFGAGTEGAESSPDGFETYHVMSLADDGSPGTLRDAVSQGKRYIVFDLGGTITLTNDLNVAFSYTTIDGLSAPSPGITIVQPGDIGTMMEARNSVGPISDVIIHHLRMEGMATTQTGVGDIWGIDGENHPVSNIVLDHITATAATDGVFDIWEDVSDVTISWNLVRDTEAMMHLTRDNASSTTVRQRVSYHHNVLAGNNERQVRLRHNNQLIDYVNNVVYGWGWFEGGAAGLHIVYDAGEVNPSINVINNIFHDVPGLFGNPGDAIKFERGADEGLAFFSGNVVPAAEADNASNGAALVIPSTAQVTTMPTASLASQMVPLVGTHFPTTEETNLLGTIATAVAP